MTEFNYHLIKVIYRGNENKSITIIVDCNNYVFNKSSFSKNTAHSI